jgi:hypothetical protein
LVFRRSLLDVADAATRPPSRYAMDMPMFHDEWIFFLGNVCGSVLLVSTPLLRYRRHTGNLSTPARADRHTRLRPAVDDYRNAAALYSAYGRYLEKAAAEADPTLRDRLMTGADFYFAGARRWKQRAQLYESHRRRSRVALVRRLLTSGGYRPQRHGGCGRAALAKDLIGGVVLGLGDSRLTSRSLSSTE